VQRGVANPAHCINASDSVTFSVRAWCCARPAYLFNVSVPLITEADTCRKYILPRLTATGWDTAPYSFTEQKTFTDGRILLVGDKAHRGPQKRADYLLRYTRDFTIAVVGAKAAYKSASDGLQQAKDYAEVLGLKFAYSTNGHGIIEFDYLTGLERELEAFPTPGELWARYCAGQQINRDAIEQKLLSPSQHLTGKSPRYYQEIAINRTVQAVLRGKRRILLTMATALARRWWPFKSAGSCGTHGGIAPANIAARVFYTWPIAIF
jgi:type I restriction enzyme R subunit